MHFEVHGPCASCCVEGAVTEIWDTEAAPCRLGVPLGAACRLCGHAREGRAADARVPGEGCPACGADLDDASREAHLCPMCGARALIQESVPARVPRTLAELEGALDAWARAEGLRAAKELLESSFVLGDLAAVHAAMTRGEPVETTFDVTDLLFSAGGAGGGAEPAIEREEEAPSTQRMAPPPSIRRYGGPRDELLALASVSAADGDANPHDLAALERAAYARGIPPLPLAEVRVRRPAEIDPPPRLVDRERVLEEMFKMAWADGEMDESELRVIRDFARVWGIDPERLAEWTRLYTFSDSSGVERWFRRIGQMIFPER